MSNLPNEDEGLTMTTLSDLSNEDDNPTSDLPNEDDKLTASDLPNDEERSIFPVVSNLFRALEFS